MPPKKEETTAEVQVFNLDNLNPALLPELASFKEKQMKVVEDNPFVIITDTASRDLAKKYRTARVSARTSLQSQDKLISSKFNEAKTKAKTYIAELIAITKPGEDKQQEEIDRDEAEAEAKRQEKARLEQQRIESIKKEIDDYVAEWKTAFNIMSYDSIEKVSADFLESYTTYDLTVLQEFEALFPSKIEELTQYLSGKTSSLTNAENARLEKLRLEEEAKQLAIMKAELEAEKKLTAEVEAKAKKEREDFEKEKAEFATKKQISDRKNTLSDLGINENIVLSKLGVSGHAMLMNMLVNGSDNDFKIECDDVIKRIAELEAKKVIVTETPSSEPTVIADGYSTSETPQPEKVEVPEILAPVETTASVCTSLEEEKVDCIASRLVPIVDEINISELKQMQSTTTWDSIEKDFKNSGEKSYSKWLKNNYNVPTKL